MEKSPPAGDDLGRRYPVDSFPPLLHVLHTRRSARWLPRSTSTSSWYDPAVAWSVSSRAGNGRNDVSEPPLSIEQCKAVAEEFHAQVKPRPRPPPSRIRIGGKLEIDPGNLAERRVHSGHEIVQRSGATPVSA
jgi:hypothetical protein